MTHANNPTEQQAELERAIVNYRIKCDIALSDRDEGVITQQEYEESIVWELSQVMQLFTQYGNARELEGRIDELKKTGGPNDAYENIGHLLASNVKERINELTKAKGEA